MRSFLFLKLGVIQICIRATVREKLLVISLLNNFTVIKNKN